MFEAEMIVLAVLSSVACALPGALLVTRKMSMMSDSITHTVLLGIVLAFFVTRDLNSPLLIVGAALIGLLTVFLTDAAERTKLVSGDSSIGLVFPFLFSVAVILISAYAGDIHLDTDSVLLGEIVLAPFDRLKVGGLDLGPKALWVMSAVLAVSVIFTAVFYKEIKITLFDREYAMMSGFKPVLVNYLIMLLVSLTAVAAFSTAGSVLVVALMIVPAATARIISDRFGVILPLSAGIGALCSLTGTFSAISMDISAAGGIAVAAGILFAAVILFYPKTGALSKIIQKAKNRRQFYELTVMYHILNHQGSPEESVEAGEESFKKHLNLKEGRGAAVLRSLIKKALVTTENGVIKLTENGKRSVCEAQLRLFGESGGYCEI